MVIQHCRLPTPTWRSVWDEEDSHHVVTTSDSPNCSHLVLCILGKILLLKIDKNGVKYSAEEIRCVFDDI